MRKLLFFACLTGFSGVVLGAFGAHALKARLLQTGMEHAWQTAVLYQLLHAGAALGVGLVGVVLSRSPIPSAGAVWLRRAVVCWLLGIGLFSGSLYWLCLDGPRWLGPVTPLGGFAFLGGWAFAALGCSQLARE